MGVEEETDGGYWMVSRERERESGGVLVMEGVGGHNYVVKGGYHSSDTHKSSLENMMGRESFAILTKVVFCPQE